MTSKELAIAAQERCQNLFFDETERRHKITSCTLGVQVQTRGPFSFSSLWTWYSFHQIILLPQEKCVELVNDDFVKWPAYLLWYVRRQQNVEIKMKLLCCSAMSTCWFSMNCAKNCLNYWCSRVLKTYSNWNEPKKENPAYQLFVSWWILALWLHAVKEILIKAHSLLRRLLLLLGQGCLESDKMSINLSHECYVPGIFSNSSTFQADRNLLLV